jgi:hypothetical protein
MTQLMLSIYSILTRCHCGNLTYQLQIVLRFDNHACFQIQLSHPQCVPFHPCISTYNNYKNIHCTHEVGGN